MQEELLRLDRATRRITSEFYIREIDLTIYKGEVLALIGKNAAGKSTLTGVINGSLPAESGRIFFEGREVRIGDTTQALGLGIITLMQNNRGFPELSVADNVLFGNPQYFKTGSLSNKKMCEICAPCFAQLGIALDPTARFGDLTPAQKQTVSIARAYLFRAKLIIMDEPSSHLPEKECDALYRTVNLLRGMGISVIYITHRLSEVPLLADRVAIVEHGEIKEVRSAQGLTELELIECVEGHRVEDIYGKQPVELGAPLLELANVSCGAASEVTLTLRAGEVLALLAGAGECGAGIRGALLGLSPYKGEIRVGGKPVRVQNPLISNALRIAAAVDEETERRLQSYDSKGGSSTGTFAALRAKTKENVDGIGRMLSGVFGMDRLQHSEYMTGGYRQRELVQRTLHRDADIYILVDAVNGIDLQSKMRLYADIVKLALRGKSVLYFTNDAEEAVGVADRVLVLGENTVVFDTYAKETTAADLIKLLKA